jgi:hypothetical protein
MDIHEHYEQKLLYKNVRIKVLEDRIEALTSDLSQMARWVEEVRNRLVGIVDDDLSHIQATLEVKGRE